MSGILRSVPVLLAIALIAAISDRASAQQLSQTQQLAKDVFRELIEINTTSANGNTTQAAEAVAARLRAAGFAAEDLQILEPVTRKGNLVVRFRGRESRRKPLLLLAHLDVVEARREDWSIEPFKFTEKDGFYYGRGTTDDKAMASIFVANLIRMKQEGFVPDRDIVLALTADEESSDNNANGVKWLLSNKRSLVDAEYGLNEGGGGQSSNGKKLMNRVGASEKVYLDFRVEVTNPGGHSSQPRKDNAIYQLANALTKLEKFAFPVKLNEVTRTYFDRMSRMEAGITAADMRAVSRTNPDPQAIQRLSAVPMYNAMMRTTCVATRIEAGHANNALPQMARATVNCRLLPGEADKDVLATLTRVFANDSIKVTAISEFKPSSPSPLLPEVMNPIERITAEMWPGVTVVPAMGTGATDGLYFRQSGIPVFGVSGLFSDMNDSRAHGRDERIGVKEFYEGQEFLYRLVRALSSPRPAT